MTIDTKYTIPRIPPKTIEQRLNHLPQEVYKVGSGHLFNLMSVLCGEAGAGGLKKQLLLTRLQGTLANTNFFDLDQLFGDPLRFPRLSNEIYPYNPYDDYLTNTQWDEIYIKDSIYRNRIYIYMKAIAAGNTKEGIALCAESVLGTKVDIIENYQYLDSLLTDKQYLGRLNVSSREEITICPPRIVTQQEERSILKAIDSIRPMDRIFTVNPYGVTQHNEIKIQGVCASSEYIEVQKSVAGRTDWPFSARGNTWVEAGDRQDAKYKAWMTHQEWSIDMMNNVKEMSATSVKIGMFNPIQTSLFHHLPKLVNSDFVWSANLALKRSPIVQTQVNWTLPRGFFIWSS